MTALLKLAPLAGLLMLASCQTPTATGAIDTSCLTFEPIRYSRKDTIGTQRQARGHNAAYDALCKEDDR